MQGSNYTRMGGFGGGPSMASSVGNDYTRMRGYGGSVARSSGSRMFSRNKMIAGGVVGAGALGGYEYMRHRRNRGR